MSADDHEHGVTILPPSDKVPRSIEIRLNWIFDSLNLLHRKVTHMANELSNLQASGSALVAAVDSLISVADAIKAKLDALVNQDTISPADVQAVSDSLASETAKVVADLAVLNPAPQPSA